MARGVPQGVESGVQRILQRFLQRGELAGFFPADRIARLRDNATRM